MPALTTTAQKQTGVSSLQVTKTVSAGANQQFRINDNQGSLRSLPGPSLSAWVYVPATTGLSNVSAKLQLQDSSFTYQSGPSFTVPTGTWTQVTWTPSSALLASCRAMVVQIDGSWSVGGTWTAYLDQVETGTVTTGTRAWEIASQAVVAALRAQGDTHTLMIPGVAYAGVQSWPTNHPTGWITDPSGNYLYEGHHYWDSDHSGTYPSTYAAENTAAIGQGWSAGAYPDALTNRTLTELAAWVTWLRANAARGYVGEFGWPQGTADATTWNTLGNTWFAAADSAALWATQWSTGEWWGNYILNVYGSTAGFLAATTTASATNEAHPSRGVTVTTPPGSSAALSTTSTLTASPGQAFAGLANLTTGVALTAPAGQNRAQTGALTTPSVLTGAGSYQAFIGQNLWTQPTLFAGATSQLTAALTTAVTAGDTFAPNVPVPPFTLSTAPVLLVSQAAVSSVVLSTAPVLLYSAVQPATAALTTSVGITAAGGLSGGTVQGLAALASLPQLQVVVSFQTGVALTSAASLTTVAATGGSAALTTSAGISAAGTVTTAAAGAVALTTPVALAGPGAVGQAVVAALVTGVALAGALPATVPGRAALTTSPGIAVGDSTGPVAALSSSPVLGAVVPTGTAALATSAGLALTASASGSGVLATAAVLTVTAAGQVTAALATVPVLTGPGVVVSVQALAALRTGASAAGVSPVQVVGVAALASSPGLTGPGAVTPAVQSLPLVTVVALTVLAAPLVVGGVAGLVTSAGLSGAAGTLPAVQSAPLRTVASLVAFSPPVAGGVAGLLTSAGLAVDIGAGTAAALLTAVVLGAVAAQTTPPAGTAALTTVAALSGSAVVARAGTALMTTGVTLTGGAVLERGSVAALGTVAVLAGAGARELPAVAVLATVAALAAASAQTRPATAALTTGAGLAVAGAGTVPTLAGFTTAVTLRLVVRVFPMAAGHGRVRVARPAGRVGRVTDLPRGVYAVPG